jgi:hypothetical protein
MRRVTWAALAAGAFFWACGAPKVVQLQPEEPSILHVGDVAAVRVPAESDDAIGTAGQALALIKRTGKRGTLVYFYRAVASGNQTFVLTPRIPGPDGCISCLTVHYFVKVVD